jgi:hypothetical protein
MFRVTRTFTRPNTEVLWHFQVLDGSYFRTTYLESGKCIFLNNQVSADGLLFYHEAYWQNKELWEEHRQDPIMIEYFRLRDEHNQLNGIIADETQTEDLE